jgi:hypothetical protein
MSKRFCSIGLLFCAGLVQAADRPPASSVEVLVFAQPADAELVRAGMEEAARVYERAGVAIRWRTCSGDECMNASEDALILRVQQRSPAGTVDAGLLGQAIGGIGGGRYATVFLASVNEFAARRTVELPVVLGHVIAHEIGHLLLADSSHAASGLMRAHWQPADVASMRSSGLAFSKGGVRTIRSRLGHRSMVASN